MQKGKTSPRNLLVTTTRVVLSFIVFILLFLLIFFLFFTFFYLRNHVSCQRRRENIFGLQCFVRARNGWGLLITSCVKVILFFLLFNESCKLPEETIKHIWSPMFCESKKRLRLCDDILCQRLLVFLWKVRPKFVAPNSCLRNWCDNCYGTFVLYHTV